MPLPVSFKRPFCRDNAPAGQISRILLLHIRHERSAERTMQPYQPEFSPYQHQQGYADDQDFHYLPEDQANPVLFRRGRRHVDFFFPIVIPWYPYPYAYPYPYPYPYGWFW